MFAGSITNLMTSLVVELPLFLVWLAGIVWAMRTWRNHPRVSLLVIIGLAIQFVDLLASTTTNAMLPMLITKYGYSMQSLGWLYAAVGAGRSLTSTAAWAVLLVAMFGWRPVPVPASGGTL